MQTNEQEDTYGATEQNSMPQDKNIKHGENLTNNHEVNHVVQTNSKSEQMNVDQEPVISKTEKNTEETAHKSSFAGLFILAELATALAPSVLPLAEPVANAQDVAQSSPHSSMQCSPIYEEKNKSEPRKKIEEKHSPNIFGNLLVLAELAAALTPAPSPIELVDPEGNTSEMSPHEDDNAMEYEHVMPYVEVMEPQLDTSAVTPPPYASGVDPEDFLAAIDSPESENTPPQDDDAVELEEVSQFLEFVGSEEDTPNIITHLDDGDIEYEYLAYH